MNWFKNLNLPNKLTVIRVFAIPVFLIFLYISKGIFKFMPLLIFAGAAVTDAIDGHIARRDNLITDFGKFMDPLADKLLTASAFIAFVEIGYLSSWVVVLIISIFSFGIQNIGCFKRCYHCCQCMGENKNGVSDGINYYCLN